MVGHKYPKKALHLHSVLLVSIINCIWRAERFKEARSTTIHQPSSRDVCTSAITNYYIGSGPGPKCEQAVVKAEVKFSYFLRPCITCSCCWSLL